LFVSHHHTLEGAEGTHGGIGIRMAGEEGLAREEGAKHPGAIARKTQGRKRPKLASRSEPIGQALSGLPTIEATTRAGRHCRDETKTQEQNLAEAEASCLNF
jgi:hypothetical protein